MRHWLSDSSNPMDTMEIMVTKSGGPGRLKNIRASLRGAMGVAPLAVAARLRPIVKGFLILLRSRLRGSAEAVSEAMASGLDDSG